VRERKEEKGMKLKAPGDTAKKEEKKKKKGLVSNTAYLGQGKGGGRLPQK